MSAFASILACLPATREEAHFTLEVLFSEAGQIRHRSDGLFHLVHLTGRLCEALTELRRCGLVLVFHGLKLGVPEVHAAYASIRSE